MKLDNLFKWQKELVIKDSDGEPFEVNGEPLTLYQRIVGDAELSEARKSALRASRRLRKQLRDPDSAEAASMLPEFEVMDAETIRSALLITEAGDIRSRAEQLAQKPRYPTEPPSEASLEAKEEYQHEMDTYDTRVEEAIEEQMQVLIDKRKEELEKFSRDKLVDMFSTSIIDNVSRREMLEVFNSRCAYYATYEDEALTERAFSSYEAFENAAPELKNQIINSYLELEMRGDEIKKSD